ncbi:MAG: NADAR family protein [Syntrophaceae bacterium]|nr:NADAR family protein [Syntrophaceae bacterium]
MLEKIMAAGHPREQKAFGRKVSGFVPDMWNAVARDVVYRGNMAKFTQNPELMRNLLNTRGTLLVEASPTDDVWGIKMAEDADGIENPNNWQGTNWLGETLTKVRDDLSYWIGE